MKKYFSLIALTLITFSVQAQDIGSLMEEWNEALADQGLGVQIHRVEYMVDPNAGMEIMGRTIFANDRTLTLNTRWVPNDPRRLADGNNLTYLQDPRYALANGSINSEPIIDNTFEVWDNATPCSNLPLVKRPFTGVEPNFVLGLIFGFAGDPFQADITTTGFLPGFVFDLIANNGSQYILGATFTLNFIDQNGNPTDINGDGYIDVALKEVWYNDAFLWSTDGVGGIDIGSVALHENGHALGLGHFGTIFTNPSGKLHVSPRALMNASYLGVVPEPMGTDNAAHCIIYGSWPNQ